MSNRVLFTGALLAGLAVAAGAFGAHGLQRLTMDERILHTYHTAVQYQFWHAAAILLAGLFYRQQPKRCFKWAANCFMGGIAGFSGSLYLITYFKIQQLPVGWWGPVTPLGGLFFMLGWVLFAWGLLKQEGSN